MAKPLDGPKHARARKARTEGSESGSSGRLRQHLRAPSGMTGIRHELRPSAAALSGAARYSGRPRGLRSGHDDDSPGGDNAPDGTLRSDNMPPRRVLACRRRAASACALNTHVSSAQCSVPRCQWMTSPRSESQKHPVKTVRRGVSENAYLIGREHVNH